MHRKLVFAAIVLCAAAGGSRGTPGGVPPAARDLEALEDQLRRILGDHGVPAASVALVDRDAALWTAGVGVADLASGRAATADTLFRVGSISKTVTALAVLSFVEEGRLSLDDRVRDLVPGVAFENPWAGTDPVLLAHLLEHTAGFDDMHPPEYAHDRGDPPISLRQGLAFHPHSRLSRWRPGRYMSYSNSGSAVAAAALEELAGRPFEEIAADRVLRPLGMTAATFFEPDRRLRATGYAADGETPGDYWHVLTRPSGSLNASAREMAALVRMFLNRGAVDGAEVWRPSTIDRMEWPATTAAARAGLRAGYGLANVVTQHEGFVWHGHFGVVQTFVADFAYEPEHGVGFFAAINVANGRALRRIRDALRAHLTRGLRPSPEPAREVSAAELAEVEGTYQRFTPRQERARFLSGYAGVAVARLRGGDLYLGTPFERGDPLVALGDRRFRGEKDGRASWIYLPGTEDGDLLLGRGNYRRVSAAGVWLRWTVTALCAALTATSVLFALVWVPRLAVHRLRGAAPPFSRASLARRAQPLAAVLALAFAAGCFAFGLGDPIERFGAPTLASVGFAAGTLVYALLALASAVQWWRTRAEDDVRRGIRVHSLWVNLAQLLTVAALAFWGLLGMRTWA